MTIVPYCGGVREVTRNTFPDSLWNEVGKKHDIRRRAGQVGDLNLLRVVPNS